MSYAGSVGTVSAGKTSWRGGRGGCFFGIRPLIFAKAGLLFDPVLGDRVLLSILQVKVQGADAQFSNKIV